MGDNLTSLYPMVTQNAPTFKWPQVEDSWKDGNSKFDFFKSKLFIYEIFNFCQKGICQFE